MHNQYMIGTVEIRREPNSPHATLKAWNRGGLAGELTVLWEDASPVAKRLLGVDNATRSDCFAEINGERVEYDGPGPDDITEDNAEAKLAAHEAAEEAKAKMAEAVRVIRMRVDHEENQRA